MDSGTKFSRLVHVMVYLDEYMLVIGSPELMAISRVLRTKIHL